MDNALHEYLRSLSPGQVPDEDHLINLLREAWPNIEGNDLERMGIEKLGRAYEFDWQPSMLTFNIERHGAIVVGGSSRAERQRWEVDVKRRTATVETRGYAQVRPRSPVFKTGPVAAELTDAIVNRRNDPRLRWSKAGKVQVRMKEVLPAGPKETTEGRQKRLNSDLQERLAPLGWTRSSAGWWSAPD